VRILLVDDNALFLASARRFLGNFPAVESVRTARDGLEAMEHLKQHSGPERPDVVLIDLNMPGMNGFEATKRMKALVPDIRIIIVSLHDMADFRTAAARAGAEHFVAKQDFATVVPALLQINGVSGAHPEPLGAPGLLRSGRND
jgi:DNA-binding NarL/FixJ family response regulator